MDGIVAADDLASESLTNRLESQADAEYGYDTGQLTHNLHTDTGLIRGAWPWRDDHVGGILLQDLSWSDLVVSEDDYLAIRDFPQELNQVVDERIIIVYYQYSLTHGPQEPDARMPRSPLLLTLFQLLPKLGKIQVHLCHQDQQVIQDIPSLIDGVVTISLRSRLHDFSRLFFNFSPYLLHAP